VGLVLAAVLTVWWFLAAGTGPDYFAMVDGLVTSWIGGLIMILSLAALWYHTFSGIRHLIWDTGRWFDLDTVHKTGIGVFAAAGLMTVITLVAAF
jgi:succinate dehydrogenase / fumarate reductase cytochrome b subunit